MLIRVRLPRGTLKLRVEASLSYADVLSQIRQEASIPAECKIALSLNKKDSLPGLDAASIGSLGIAGGDLVYLLEDGGAPLSSTSATAAASTPTALPLPPGYRPSAATVSATATASRPSPGAAAAAAAEARAAAAVTTAASVGGSATSSATPMQVDDGSNEALHQLVGMGFTRERAGAALARSGGELERAVELLVPSAPPSTRLNAAAAPMEISHASIHPASSASSSASSSILADARGNALLSTAPPRPPIPTSLVPQAWLDGLDALLAGGGAASTAEALCLMLHLQLSHAGFVLRSTAAGDVAGSAGDVAGSAGDVAGSAGDAAAARGGGSSPPPLPAGWRQVPGLYTFGYSHERAQQPPLAAASAASCPPATTLTIKAIPMGPLLMVHGLLDGGPPAQLANGGSATPPPPCVLSAQLKLTEYAKHRDVKPVASSASGLSSLPSWSISCRHASCSPHARRTGRYRLAAPPQAAARRRAPSASTTFYPSSGSSSSRILTSSASAGRWRSARPCCRWLETSCCGSACTRRPTRARPSAAALTSMRRGAWVLAAAEWVLAAAEWVLAAAEWVLAGRWQPSSVARSPRELPRPRNDANARCSAIIVSPRCHSFPAASPTGRCPTEAASPEAAASRAAAFWAMGRRGTTPTAAQAPPGFIGGDFDRLPGGFGVDSAVAAAAFTAGRAACCLPARCLLALASTPSRL